MHLVIFPEQKPDLSTYFKPGSKFGSTAEKVEQTVIKHEKEIVYCAAKINPFAPGPPVHIHTNFDETFEVENGTLSVLINGELKRLKPGEKLFVPRGTPHKPFNETDETIRLKGEIAFPEKFAFNLVQIYGLLDNNPDFVKSPKAILQIIMFTTEGFDSYIDDGPPVVIQKVAGFLIAPMARLFGFKSYYKEYDVLKN
ncbi:cupin domain-containing protein (plasmid) [Leptospira sp. WS60.C2]